MKEVRQDMSRAGLRSQDPYKMPAAGTQMVAPAESRSRCVPHRYGNQERTPCPSRAKAPKGSAADVISGKTETTETSSNSNAALGNYLNDMKRYWTKQRIQGTPSNALVRMNE